MQVVADPSFLSLTRRLELAQSSSGVQIFLGRIRIEIIDNQVVLFSDENTWDTADGETINIRTIRDPRPEPEEDSYERTFIDGTADHAADFRPRRITASGIS